jgi:outer membrane protein assembly factor BamB
MISCLDAATGRKLWRKDDFKAWPNFFPSSSPLILDDFCVAQLGGRDNGAVVAYTLASGEEKWKWSGDSPGYASLALMQVGGKKLLIAETDKRIVALDAANGALVWETPYTVSGRGYNASTPFVDGQTLYFAGSGRGVKAVKLEKEGDKFVGKELWSNPDKSVQFNSPVLKDGLIYGLTANNEFFCLKAKDGTTAWSAPFPTAETAAGSSPAGGGEGGAGGTAGAAATAAGAGGGGRRRGGGGGGGYGSIVDAGSVLIALTPGSQLVVFEPGEKEFKKVAAYKVAESQTHAHPVLSGNRIFIKDKESMILWTID